ncbi:lysophosphatidic acid receptor 6 [Centroberyx affinis]|uniref:lysophosphatidic acid receptor 6 n=1 Tax=Centroberyx affinis TaxID=166261 RepID=UPI003A5BEAE7
MSIINTTTACHNHSTGQTDIVFVSVYSVISVMGLVLNVTALVIFRHTKSRSHTTVYMTNLAVADLLLVLTLPMRIYYHLGYTDLPQKLCDWVGLVLLANMYGSIFLLTCICFDRCMAVTFPMSPRVQEARKKAPLICIGVWTLTFGASLPVYLSRWNVSREEHCFETLPVYATRPVVIFSTLSVGFGIPLAVMLICSWGLVRAIRRSTAAQTDLVDSKKIQRMIAASLFIFLLSFLPYHATLGILYLYGKAIPCTLLAAYHYSLMVACLNAMLDPIAYYFTTETFRRKVDMDAVRKMLPLNSQGSIEANSKSRGPINT